MRRQAAQLLIDEREQRLERVGFAPVPGEEQRRGVRTWLGNEGDSIPGAGWRTFSRPFPAFLGRRETTMTNSTRTTGSTNITISALILASAFMTVGCAQTFARHDLFERSDNRLQRAVQTARRTCQKQQPKTALPSTADYERCVLAELRNAESTAAKR